MNAPFRPPSDALLDFVRALARADEARDFDRRTRSTGFPAHADHHLRPIQHRPSEQPVDR
ncbi:hypothetical protein [Sphingobium yanoikuyae]|uniref:hypothetical protein n=1 Tax=Sphingobium yanoikuyae TaxID=13690 RepID=UPI0024301AD7|nr:hypothetical protein [Sphingobium yanoikuyae]